MEELETPESIGLVREDREPRLPWMREWRSPGGVAVGMNEDGTVDELLGPYFFHVEQMDKNHYWARFGDLHVNFWSADGKLRLTLGWLELGGNTA